MENEFQVNEQIVQNKRPAVVVEDRGSTLYRIAYLDGKEPKISIAAASTMKRANSGSKPEAPASTADSLPPVAEEIMTPTINTMEDPTPIFAPVLAMPEPVTESAPEATAALPQNEHPATAHLRLFYEPTDEIFFLFLPRVPGKTIETHLMSAKEAFESSCVEFLQAKSNEGFDIFAALNPIQPGKKQRKKEFAGKPHAVFMDVDYAGDNTLAALRQSIAAGTLPKPTTIIQSSPGRFQAAWRINSEDFTVNSIESVNKALISEFAADTACSDVLRVLRVPGFPNLKYVEKPIVTVIETNEGGPYNLADFHFELEEAKVEAAKPPATAKDLISIATHFEDGAREANITTGRLKKWGTAGYLWELTCPWVSKHTGHQDSGTAVILMNSGALVFTCRHTHC